MKNLLPYGLCLPLALVAAASAAAQSSSTDTSAPVVATNDTAQTVIHF